MGEYKSLRCYHWLICHMHFRGHGSIQRAKIRFKCHTLNFLNFCHWSANILSYIINMKNVADLMVANETVSPRNANRKKITSKALSRLVLAAAPGMRAARWHCAVWQWAQGDSTRVLMCSGAVWQWALLGLWSWRCVWGLLGSAVSHNKWVWEGVQGWLRGCSGTGTCSSTSCRQETQPPCPQPGCSWSGAAQDCAFGCSVTLQATWCHLSSKTHVPIKSRNEHCRGKMLQIPGFSEWLWFLMFKAENCICSWRQFTGIKTKGKRLVSKYVTFWPW